jgi:predicted amidohydrolase
MRIAVVQCSNILDDACLAGDAIVERLCWAEEEGIDLIIFPEAFLLGHSYDPETIRSRASVAASAIAALCERVAAFRSTLVVGAFDLVDGQVFNRAIIIESGRVVGRYSKAHPNEPGVTAGSDFPTFLRSDVRYGVNICNDATIPAPRNASPTRTRN